MSREYEYLKKVEVTDAPGQRFARIRIDRVDRNGYPSQSYEQQIHLPRDLDEAHQVVLALELATDMLRAALVIARDEARLKTVKTAVLS